jgi:hypothetical protein
MEKNEQTAVERFFHNPRVLLEELISYMENECRSIDATGRHILVLQDTTEFNFHSHRGRFDDQDPDLGVLSDDRSTGLLAHPGLALDAQTQLPMGFSYLRVYNYPFNRLKKNERDYVKQPIEEKHSHRWLEAVERSAKNLASADQITVIGDRESDIYEVLASSSLERVKLLIRSCWNRKVADGRKLEELIASEPIRGLVPLVLSATPSRTARKALLQLKWCATAIKRPDKRATTLADYPTQVPVWVVDLEEVFAPPGESPIHWRLFTTHPISTQAEALQIIEWYKLRWWIEELFRLIKTQGFRIEESQFSTGAALKKLIALTLQQALKVLTLKQARTSTQLDASICFDEQEKQFLKVIQPKVEGRTKKQQNPYQINTIAWATWIIARLGGWTPADMTTKPPGVITLRRGLETFQKKMDGWLIAIEFLGLQTPKYPDG